MLNHNVVDDVTLQDFKELIKGRVILPGEPDYETSRKIFNGMIDKHPALIVKCEVVDDIIRSVIFAKHHKLLLSVKGGGHGVAGYSVCEGGLMVDLSNMRGVSVDPLKKTAKVDPGATWRDMDQATQEFGLATTGGQVSSTGVAGLTLGGGHGWLMGLCGRTCDNLLSADVVTAEGSLIKADTSQNYDLFWALRGGGGNFGIVSAFEFKLYPVKDVLAGMLIYPITRSMEVLRLFKKIGDSAPDELGLMAVLTTMPEGTKRIPVAIIEVCFAGPIEKGEKVIQEARRMNPIIDNVQPMLYREFQKLMDPIALPGRQQYWKSGYFRDLSIDAMKTLIDYFHTSPSALTRIHVELHNGKACRGNPSDTAFIHRNLPYNLIIAGVWLDKNEAEINREWIREFWLSLDPFLTKKVYVNFLSEEGDERVKAAYGDNYERLVNIKNKYDPENFFRLNQNILPSNPAN